MQNSLSDKKTTYGQKDVLIYMNTIRKIKVECGLLNVYTLFMTMDPSTTEHKVSRYLTVKIGPEF